MSPHATLHDAPSRSLSTFFRRLSFTTLESAPPSKRGSAGGSRHSLIPRPQVKLGDNRWQAFFPTVLYSVAALGIGACHALPAPPHAQGSTLETGAFVVSKLLAFFLGTLVGGFLLDRVPRQLFLLFFLASATAAVSLLPFAHNPPTSFFLTANLGFSLAVLELGANIFILDLWGENADPFLYTYSFFFAVGAGLIPAVIGPFLLSSTPPLNYHNAIILQPFQGNASNTSSLWQLDTTGSMRHEKTSHFWEDWLQYSFLNATHHNHRHQPQHIISRVNHAYLLVSAFLLSSTLQALLPLALFPLETPPLPEVPTSSVDRPYLEAFLLGAAYFFILGQASLQSTVAIRCPSPILFWGAFTLSRFLTVMSSIWVYSRSLIVGNFLLTLIGACVYCLAEGMGLPPLSLTASAAIAFGSAPLVPATLCWVADHLCLSNKRASPLLLALFLGEAILPLCTTVSLHAPLYNIMASGAVGILGLGSLLSLTSLLGAKRATRDWYSPEEDEDGD